jgi:hypothetical protein
MRHIHCSAECVRGVGEDMYLTYVLQTNIIGLTDAIRNCLQFGIARCDRGFQVPTELALKGLNGEFVVSVNKSVEGV